MQLTGQTSNINVRPQSRLRKSHGALNMVGWGILMIIGAIVARHFRQWDPVWFYVHICIQSLGFLLGIAGVICGIILENRLGADVSTHKGLGVFLLVLGCLQVSLSLSPSPSLSPYPSLSDYGLYFCTQVMAFLARPEKSSKVRKYWNWYHYSVGRILIIFAVANVFYGIHLGKEGREWKGGYGGVLAILFVIALILEVRMWMKKWVSYT